MEPPPGRRTRLAVRLVVILCPLGLLSACGPDQAVPAAPATTVKASPTIPAPYPTAESSTPSATAATSAATSTARPSGWPTYSQPAEAACVLPTDAPATVPGADGPTLTAKRVDKAWRASEEGKGNQPFSGTVSARDLKRMTPSPSMVLAEPGVHYAGFSAIEYTGLRTYVYADPGRAAAKLAAVRLMLRKPCSYDYTSGMGGPFVVTELGEDSPDLVVAKGAMQGVSVSDMFVRYGNTVTDFSAALAVVPSSDVVPMVLATLGKA